MLVKYRTVALYNFRYLCNCYKIYYKVKNLSQYFVIGRNFNIAIIIYKSWPVITRNFLFAKVSKFNKYYVFSGSAKLGCVATLYKIVDAMSNLLIKKESYWFS